MSPQKDHLIALWGQVGAPSVTGRHQYLPGPSRLLTILCRFGPQLLGGAVPEGAGVPLEEGVGTR